MGGDSEPEGLEGDEDGPEFENLDDLESGSESDGGGDVAMMDEEDEFDEEGFGEEEEEEEHVEKKVKNNKTAKKEKKKKQKFDPTDLGSLLADAEEFAHLIDENEDSGGTDA